jgi:hypothetical protein
LKMVKRGAGGLIHKERWGSDAVFDYEADIARVCRTICPSEFTFEETIILKALFFERFAEPFGTASEDFVGSGNAGKGSIKRSNEQTINRR